MLLQSSFQSDVGTPKDKAEDPFNTDYIHVRNGNEGN